MAIIDNLVSYWKLDEASGDAIDSHGSNDATLNGTPTQGVTGKIGDAYDFTPTTDFLSVASTPTLEGFSALSITAWIKPDTNPTEDWARIVSKAQGSGTDDYALTYTQENNSAIHNFIAFRINSTAGTTTLKGTTINVWDSDTWVFFCATWDGDEMIVYVDGVLDGTDNNTGTLDDTNQPLGIGGHALGSTRRFGGIVDEVGIWDRALSLEEIEDLYNSGDGLAYPFGEPPEVIEIVKDLIYSGMIPFPR